MPPRRCVQIATCLVRAVCRVEPRWQRSLASRAIRSRPESQKPGARAANAATGTVQTPASGHAIKYSPRRHMEFIEAQHRGTFSQRRNAASRQTLSHGRRLPAFAPEMAKRRPWNWLRPPKRDLRIHIVGYRASSEFTRSGFTSACRCSGRARWQMQRARQAGAGALRPLAWQQGSSTRKGPCALRR